MRCTTAFHPSTKLAIFALALSMPCLQAQHQFPPPTAPQSAPLTPTFASSIEFPYFGHEVADLDKSIEWYSRLHFQVAIPPSPWAVDETLNQLGNTPGAESRTAVLKIRGSGDMPFTLVLHQFRGVTQQNWSKPQPTDKSTARLRSDARLFLKELGLISSQAAVGDAQIEDLDGFVFNGTLAANHTLFAGLQRNGVTLSLVDRFTQSSGASNPADQSLHVFDATQNPQLTPEAAKFQDVNANYAAFKVSNLDALYTQAKEQGAVTVSEGGILDYNNGRAVVLRDPYANSFFLLWQPRN